MLWVAGLLAFQDTFIGHPFLYEYMMTVSEAETVEGITEGEASPEVDSDGLGLLSRLCRGCRCLVTRRSVVA